MWIEQLATKRDKLGAAKTIAVASSRFSESAIRTAALMGIELRTLRDITADDISSWVPIASTSHRVMAEDSLDMSTNLLHEPNNRIQEELDL
jgi:hypothetical protein